MKIAGLWGRRASLLLMAASGFAGLGYQIVWTQQAALWLGHETAAVLAVIAAFFGGVAVGAFVFGPHIEKSVRAVRWYAGCEMAIALWSGLLIFMMAPFSTAVLDLTGAQPAPLWQWTVAFFGTFILLLPATVAMGATLPALERVISQLCNEGRSLALLYAANTFGAVIGVLATAFWLVPALGLTHTAVVCIALNILCGAASLILFPKTAEVTTNPAVVASIASGVLTRLALTGFLGIGYEVLVVRVLSQVTENTVYTFAMLLAVYLAGTALGAAGYQRWFAKRSDQSKIGDRLLVVLASACLLGTAGLWAAEYLQASAQRIFGGTMTAALAAEALLALFAFGPATIVMGTVFCHLSRNANTTGHSFGRALGANTVGAAVAPLIFGVLAFPTLGPKHSLLLISVGYLALLGWRTWVTPVVWLPASATVALAIWAPPLAFITVPEGGRVVSYQEGVTAAVSVVEDANGIARLRINNRQQEGTSATLHVDGRQAWLPVLLHPAPRRVLFLGLGTGMTAYSAAQDSKLEVDAVELLPEVIAASAHFTRAFPDAPNTRPYLIAADARRYVRASNRLYDVIVSDNFHPARSGSGSLYTVEHFAAVRSRLAVGGIFCQWLPLHQLDLETLRSIVRSFIEVYPQGWSMLASNSLETPVLGLVGRADASHFDVGAVRARLRGVIPETLSNFGVEDEFALLGGFAAGPQALQRFAGNAVANTDDRPVVAYRAPRITYAPDSSPRDRLITLLREFSIRPEELIASAPDAAWQDRLSEYWAARNRFIELGREVRPSADAKEMLAQVREPLLSVLHISPDFRPAYDPLLRMALALARSDILSARELLAELARTQPVRPEAALAMRAIDAEVSGASTRDATH